MSKEINVAVQVTYEGLRYQSPTDEINGRALVMATPNIQCPECLDPFQKAFSKDKGYIILTHFPFDTYRQKCTKRYKTYQLKITYLEVEIL